MERIADRMDEGPLFDEQEREEIFQASEHLTELIKEHGFQNIIFVDASARPISTGLTSYWHKALPDERLPGIYFINPEGFHPADEVDQELRDMKKIIKSVFGVHLPGGDEPISSKSINRFREVHHQLQKNKDQPTLIVDTCIHTGDTVKLLQQAMKDSGFADTATAAVSPDPDAEAHPDFYLLQTQTKRPCYPFGWEGLVQKGDDVVSQPSDDPDGQFVGRKLREEIKEIIDEYFSQ